MHTTRVGDFNAYSDFHNRTAKQLGEAIRNARLVRCTAVVYQCIVAIQGSNAVWLAVMRYSLACSVAVPRRTTVQQYAVSIRRVGAPGWINSTIRYLLLSRPEAKVTNRA